jgi:hypothetical protein
MKRYIISESQMSYLRRRLEIEDAVNSILKGMNFYEAICDFTYDDYINKISSIVSMRVGEKSKDNIPTEVIKNWIKQDSSLNIELKYLEQKKEYC